MVRATQGLRCCLFALISMLSLLGCSAQPKPQTLARYHDEAPVVDSSRRYQLPVDTRIALAGNYGELRPNHFHGGLDFKTDQTTGHPVYCFADGYVRRAAINAYGYGLVLYVEHPSLGLTSVYGHLEGFSAQIWKKVRERQVSEQLNNADITFVPEDLPVLQGDVIALSGNTGSSGGPHVHFELRNIPQDDNDIYYDPMMYFLRELQDTQAPRISHVYLFPQPGQGVANGQRSRQVSPVNGICATQGGKGGRLGKPLTAWGRVGLGIKAYDYMDGQANKYGVKDLRLYLGDTLIYHFRQDAFRYSETRYTNSLTDYAAWVGQRSMIMKSFVEPGNLLQQVDVSLGDGIVNIDQERPYHFRYELTDAHGNVTTLSFDVQGVRSALGDGKTTSPEGFQAEALHPLRIDTAGCHFYAAPGTFYTDVDFRFRIAKTATATRTVNKKVKNKKGKMVTVKREEQYDLPCVSSVYSLGQREVPMHTWSDIAIDVPSDIANPEQLYLTNIDGTGAVRGSRFEPAKPGRPAQVCGKMREGGRYAVRRDAEGPAVIIEQPGFKRMRLHIGDGGSGVRQFRVLIDGKFVPFDMDNTGKYFGTPCHYGIVQGRKHHIEITAWDLCGNQTFVTQNVQF